MQLMGTWSSVSYQLMLKYSILCSRGIQYVVFGVLYMVPSNVINVINNYYCSTTMFDVMHNHGIMWLIRMIIYQTIDRYDKE